MSSGQKLPSLGDDPVPHHRWVGSSTAPSLPPSPVQRGLPSSLQLLNRIWEQSLNVGIFQTARKSDGLAVMSWKRLGLEQQCQRRVWGHHSLILMCPGKEKHLYLKICRSVLPKKQEKKQRQAPSRWTAHPRVWARGGCYSCTEVSVCASHLREAKSHTGVCLDFLWSASKGGEKRPVKASWPVQGLERPLSFWLENNEQWDEKMNSELENLTGLARIPFQ